MPLILTYNRFLPNLTAVTRKIWNTLQTKKDIRELFQEHPIIAFKRNKNLNEIIGGACIENGKVKKFNITTRKGKCAPCLTGKWNLCCNQVLTISTCMSQQTRQTFNIFFNCKSEHFIYIMECILCEMQYVRKIETFNTRLNNHG